MQIKYRKDIDGLRAVAVMGVLFYHLDFNLFSGGFTGVDIFFVISGFLISSIIVQEIGSRKFSFAAFYERRIRRILPAYFFLLICTSIGSYLIYAPETMVQYGRAMRYTLVFISNNLFAREVNYFDKSFNDSPLLHTWTLSVEEQFYLIWPVILVFAAKYLSQRKFNLFFILLLTSSLAASEILLFTQARLSFYMLYSRAWELGAGALLALPIFPEIQSKRKVELFSSIGLLGLLISFFLLSDTTRFPGLYATFSVIGTSLIIYSGRGQHKSHVHRLLSHRPFLYIGLISYSLYLWHWPLITFTKYYLNRSLNLTESFFIIFTSLLVSFFSYRFVETPFRKKKKHLANGHKKSQKKIFIVTALTIIAFVQLAKTIEKTGGFPSRFSEINQTELYDGNPQRKNCHLSQSETIPKNKAICSRDYGQKKALIWGDSHADHYSPALDEWARKNEISLRQISKSDCVPMVGNFDIYLLKDKKRYEKYTSCHTFNENMLQLIEEDSIDIVVIGGRWSGYLPADTEPGLYLLDGSHSTPSKAATESIFKEKFTQMVDILVKRNIQVILLGQVPIFAENPVECYFNNITPIKKYFRKTSETGAGCEMTRDEIDREVNNAHSFFRQLAKQNGVQFFDPLDEICDKDNCSALQKDKIIYHDTHHLNKAGSDFLKKPLAQKLAP